MSLGNTSLALGLGITSLTTNGGGSNVVAFALTSKVGVVLTSKTGVILTSRSVA